MHSNLSLAVGLTCAALMGFAIQRGGTCVVAAVEEIVANRRASRLAAIVEAGLWVAGGLITARSFGGWEMTATNVGISGRTLVGGALLGLGALINRACMFGTIARFGSGEWAFALTPLGFYFGCLATVPHAGNPQDQTMPSPLFSAGSLPILFFAMFALWRGSRAVQAMRAGRFAAHIWAPHRATMVIGLTFLATTLTIGSWAYSDVLAELAKGGASGLTAKLWLFGALLGGALFGGKSVGRCERAMPTPRSAARCLSGGLLMGAGSILTPGGNDSLTLIGIPLMLPYAWAALATMVLAIWFGMQVMRRSTTQ